MSLFQTLEAMAVASAEAMRPAEQLNVAEAGERFHIVRSPGSHTGPFSNAMTPYLVEPQETLTSLDFQGLVFVGPARTGKSAMAINWLAQTAICDPIDMLYVHMTQDTARDWSKIDLDKAIRHSPEIKKRLVPGRQNDNTFDKKFLSGMTLLIKWPTITHLSGKTMQRVWLFDYDRMPDSIDGEGPAYDLARKRTQTFGRFGMTVAESSPGRDIEDPKWQPKTPHEAPPTKGILGIYNQGDRRRWYWECLQCHDAFEASFQHLKYPNSADLMEAAEGAFMMCPSCAFPMTPEFKEELNAGGRWVRDGMIWLPAEKRMTARDDMKPVRSDVASFWLKGPAAHFQDWKGLVLRYLKAMQAYESTGDEEPLRTTTNVDQGEPYTPKARISERVPEELKERAEEWGSSQDLPTVPPGVRALVASVDVQRKHFVVQVQGIGTGNDIFVIDSFKLHKSERMDSEGDPLPLDPAAYPEDWDLLISKVIERTYPLAKDPKRRHMAIRFTCCDSGGEEGVAINAYDFWRKLKTDGAGHHLRFGLVKGDPNPKAPTVFLRYPDSNRRDRNSGARGDVPVIFLNSNGLKDQLSNLLGRSDTGDSERTTGGRIRYPSWMPDWFYSQITAEVRLNGKWENPRKRRNEAWDLLYYALGILRRRRDDSGFPVFEIDRIDWGRPSEWAKDWDDNPLVVDPDTGSAFVPKRKKPSLADLAKNLA